VPQVVIDNPILNSAFAEPTRHFRFGEEGITNEIIEKRRTSSYFIPGGHVVSLGRVGLLTRRCD
jgi:type III restriction enzyme